MADYEKIQVSVTVGDKKTEIVCRCETAIFKKSKVWSLFLKVSG